MMSIVILSVGRIKEPFLKAGIEEYLRRIRPYARVTVTEVPEESFGPHPGEAERAAVLSREGDKLRRHLEDDAYVVALDPKGKQVSSEEFAELLETRALEGKSRVTFIIGGPLGLSSDILDRADQIISFSSMTFPHQLFRLMLVEQLYRAFKISRREPYHW